MVRNILDCTMDHTYSGLPDLVAIKFRSKKDTTTVVTNTEDNSLIINGTFKTPMTKTPCTFGCMRLDVLQSCLKFDLFSDEKNGKLEFQYKNDIPYSLIFKSDYGHSAEYRLTPESKIEEVVQFDHIDFDDWSIVTDVHDMLYNHFKQVSVSFAKTDGKFYIKNGNDGYLYFVVGGYGADGMEFPVLECNSRWNSSFRWPIKNFNSVMRQCAGASRIEISLAEKMGLMKLEPFYDDGSKWQYYLMAAKSDE